MHRQDTFALLPKIKHLPITIILPVVAVFAVLISYLAIFATVKPVVLSYANDTCIRYPLLFPDLFKVTEPSNFDIYATDRITVGNTTLVSSSLCFVPTAAPSEGRQTVAIAPWGGVVAGKTFSISTPSPVVAKTENLSRPVLISKHLTFELSGKDTLYTYRLEVNDKSTVCTPDAFRLLCDVKTLDLKQGSPYHLKLQRFFKDQLVATLVEQDITTLSATKIADSTIRPGELVYAKPKTLEVVLDKKPKNAEVSLTKIGDSQKISTVTTITDAGLKVEWAEELPRQTDYELVVHSVEATDGSGLESPYSIPFKTSGGPRVTGISVGRAGVSLGATAVITFDQPLSEAQDVGRVVSLGGGAYLAGKRNNQLFVSLKNVAKCGDFSITLNDSLQSNYEISGGTAWSFSGRMICHTIETIGYSIRGRPINAYFFGSGPRTVLYTGAIHGNEVGTKYLMDRWIQELEANARSIPADKTVVVVPQINPDGVASGSRVNARNVDLNRNFATADWQKDVTDVNNRPFPGGGGQSSMSEPETRAIAGLAGRLRPVIVVSYHSIGGVVAGNGSGNSGSVAASYSQLSGYRNVTGSTGETFDYAVTGTAEDWYAAVGIPSLLVELGSHTSAQFERNQRAMWHIVNL